MRVGGCGLGVFGIWWQAFEFERYFRIRAERVWDQGFSRHACMYMYRGPNEK